VAIQVGIAAYRELSASDQKFALIDARPSDHFQKHHLLSASNIPLEVISERLPTVVPSKVTLILLCDDHDGGATQAVSLLEAGGYQNLALLDEGIPAWQAAGGEVFSGVRVLSQAFDEYVEHKCATPSITTSEP
ncbi:uncharacterized protein METZ01_LOCUS107550, partial [marine metagenome]